MNGPEKRGLAWRRKKSISYPEQQQDNKMNDFCGDNEGEEETEGDREVA